MKLKQLVVSKAGDEIAVMLDRMLLGLVLMLVLLFVTGCGADKKGVEIVLEVFCEKSLTEILILLVIQKDRHIFFNIAIFDSLDRKRAFNFRPFLDVL
jgi:hypothetical protein